jgi:hypothetical protein
MGRDEITISKAEYERLQSYRQEVIQLRAERRAFTEIMGGRDMLQRVMTVLSENEVLHTMLDEMRDEHQRELATAEDDYRPLQEAWAQFLAREGSELTEVTVLNDALALAFWEYVSHTTYEGKQLVPSGKYDPRQQPFIVVRDIIRMAIRMTQIAFFRRVHNYAYDLSSDPVFLCRRALREALGYKSSDMHHEADSSTLARLGIEWAKQHLEQRPPESLRTWAKGLHHAARFNRSGGLSQKEYCHQNDIGTRTLRDYLYWYDGMRKFIEDRQESGNYGGLLSE